MTNLKLFGLYRTGTNWAAHTVQTNWPHEARVWHTKGLHKHSPPQAVDGMDGYLCTIKHPYAWVTSMLAYSGAPPRDIMELGQWWQRNANLMLTVVDRRDTVLLPHHLFVERYHKYMDAIQQRFRFEQRNEYVRENHRMKQNVDASPAGRPVEATLFDRKAHESALAGKRLSDSDRKTIDRRIDWKKWNHLLEIGSL